MVQMVKKVVVSLVVAGSITVSGAGMAGAAPTTGCANSAAVLARLQSQESKVASVLATVEAQEATTPWLKWAVAFLTEQEAFLAAQVSALEARCPVGGVGSDLIG